MSGDCGTGLSAVAVAAGEEVVAAAAAAVLVVGLESRPGGERRAVCFRAREARERVSEGTRVSRLVINCKRSQKRAAWRVCVDAMGSCSRIRCSPRDSRQTSRCLSCRLCCVSRALVGSCLLPLASPVLLVTAAQPNWRLVTCDADRVWQCFSTCDRSSWHDSAPGDQGCKDTSN